MSHSEFWVSVNGTEISRTLAPILIAMTITDTDGEEADSLEIEVDDADSIAAMMPSVRASSCRASIASSSTTGS